MTPQSKWSSIAFLCIAGIAGVAASLNFRHPITPPVELVTGTYVAPNRPLPEFSLIDQHGQVFGSKNLLGHWTIMFFGYTNCPDFCPTTLATLAALEKRLRAEGAAVRPQVVFMSVDAKRDTPAQLAKYVPYFDPEFIGITALDQPTIEAAAARLGVGILLTPKPDGSYSVDHSAEVFVVNPAGKLAAILTGPLTVAALEADFERIIAAPV
jgi:protein SCO1/2